MNKTQWGVIISAAVLFGVLYFGFDTSPEKHQLIEKQRSLAAVSTDVSTLLASAKDSLRPAELAQLAPLEAQLQSASADSARVGLFKELSSIWYGFSNAAIAGHYAEEVAQLEKTEQAWSIAGTTYSICLQRASEAKVRQFCNERAVSALEKASSLNPENLQHRINLALVYAENPPQENPMKGVLMLVDLNKKHPENVSVLTQLGRLAIKTGQYDRAVERLGQAVSLEPDYPAANCLLAQALESKGQTADARQYSQKCEELRRQNN